MNSEAEPDRVRIRRTFIAESIRAVSAGVVETALITFAVLIAVNQFQSSAVIKSVLLASPAIGLLGSLIVVPLTIRLRMRSSSAAGAVSLLSVGGFLISALGAGSELWFTLGMSIGIGMIGMAIPLQTHYLRINYPTKNRGRLFSIAIVIRALTAMLVSWGFGVYLDAEFSRYPVLLWTLVVASLVAAGCHFAVPSEVLRTEQDGRQGFWESIRISRRDRVFVRLLVSAMLMGIGVLSASALRVDYLVNPKHGLEFDVRLVSLISGIVPSTMRLVSTFFWGWLFDRVDFIRLRVGVNLIFLVGVILYFMGGDFRVIIVGSALFGLARGGGEILFSLFVTKLAPAEHIADYMSVHTFLAGLRIFSAPFIGFFLVEWASVPWMLGVSVVLILISVVVAGSAGRGMVATKR